MLDKLREEAREKGVDNILASISSLNEASLKFHLKHGFLECGRVADAGIKFGKSFDVVYMQRKIQ